MLRYYLILAAVLCSGILVGRMLLPGPAMQQATPITGPPPGPVATVSQLRPGEAETLAAMQQQLQQAQLAREQLAAQLEILQLRLEELETGHAGSPAALAEDREPAPEPQVKPKTSVQALVEAGIDPEQAAWIQGRLDENDLQQLYLRDRASREGWLNQPRYHKERRKYQDAVTDLRGDIGDDAYDRMLYTLGRANRVVIRDTMLNSPAEQYGLLAGDRIIEYDGRRVFTGNELNTLVTSGDAATMTLVRVERDGKYHDIYLPRGPLGIRMSTARVLP
jgi:C-terminal processing protease CtpA/Prc